MAFLAAVLIGSAFATTYTVEFPIIMAEPDLPPGVSSADWNMEQLYLDVAPSAPDQTQTSSWSYIKCSLKDGHLTVRFDASSGNWPTSWPSSATCSGGGDTLQIDLVDGDAYEDALVRDYTFDPLVGVTIDTAPTFSGSFKYQMPAAGSFQAGVFNARLSSTTTWPGVTCQVVWEDGDPTKPWLDIMLEPDTHTANSGQCVIPKYSGSGAYHIAVTINHVAY